MVIGALLLFAPMAIQQLSITAAAAKAPAPSVIVTPQTVSNGTTVEVTGYNWPTTESVTVSECDSKGAKGQASACELRVTATLIGTSPSFDVKFAFGTGNIGTGTCNPGQTCYVISNDGSGGNTNFCPVSVIAGPTDNAQRPRHGRHKCPH